MDLCEFGVSQGYLGRPISKTKTRAQTPKPLKLSLILFLLFGDYLIGVGIPRGMCIVQ